jgi:hypothetical protein
MINWSSIVIGVSGFFCTLEVSQVNKFSVDPYGCFPFYVALMPTYSFIPTGIIGVSIPIVLVVGVCSIAKIAYAIIGFVMVFMVYFSQREFAMNIKPCKTIGEMRYTCHWYSDVTIRAKTSGRLISKLGIKYGLSPFCPKMVAGAILPNKNARFRVVTNSLTEKVRCESVGFGHGPLPWVYGCKPLVLEHQRLFPST